MNNEIWTDEKPQKEGLYKMKSPDGAIEIVEIHDLAIDKSPDRRRNFHVIHINGKNKEDPEYYALNLYDQYEEFSWSKISDIIKT